MKRRIIAVCLIALTSIASAQGFKPAIRAPRSHPQRVVVLPPCDPSKLIDLLDEFYAVPPEPEIAPEYCAPRTCAVRERAKTDTRDAKLLQDIDLMRQACRSYFPS